MLCIVHMPTCDSHGYETVGAAIGRVQRKPARRAECENYLSLTGSYNVSPYSLPSCDKFVSEGGLVVKLNFFS